MNYQEFAARTLNGNEALTPLERLSNFLIGLSGEIAELGEVILTKTYIDREEVVKEAGDVRWYIAACHSALEVQELSTTPSEEQIKDAGYLASWEHGWFMLNSRAGKLLELCKKHYFHKNEKTREEFIQALTLLRVSWIAFVYCIGLEPEQVEQTNIEKLIKRYPQGFNSEDSELRRDLAERS